MSMASTLTSSVRAALVVLLLGLAPTGPAAGGQLAASTRAATADRSVWSSPSIRGSRSARCRTGCAITSAPTRRRAIAPSCRLVVSAGSILEDENQRGLAHMVEHMAFNGSKNFPNNRIVAFMQAIGMRFGAHVNAHTGFDETRLPAADSNRGSVDRRSLVPRARGLGAERHVRSRRDRQRARRARRVAARAGPDRPHAQSQLPVLLKGSRYAERMPIGTPGDPPHVPGRTR